MHVLNINVLCITWMLCVHVSVYTYLITNSFLSAQINLFQKKRNTSTCSPLEARKIMSPPLIFGMWKHCAPDHFVHSQNSIHYHHAHHSHPHPHHRHHFHPHHEVR